jgi:hypothetical protein
MRKLLSVVLLLAPGSLLYGQLESNSLIITASRSLNPQPDQVVFAIRVTSSLSAGLDDIVAALQGSGITSSNLAVVNSVGGPSGGALAKQGLQWTFILPVSFSKMQETAGLLARIQDGVAKKNNGLAMTFNVQGTAVSPQLQQSQQCSIPALLADARTQAQNVALATGLTVGQVLAMSAGQVSAPSALLPTITSPIFVPTGFSALLIQPALPPSICSLTVKFGLLRFQ